MAPAMALPAELIAKLLEADLAPKWRVLDIAAGHGVFGIAIAKHNGNAQVVAVDWPQVLEVAKENAIIDFAVLNQSSVCRCRESALVKSPVRCEHF